MVTTTLTSSANMASGPTTDASTAAYRFNTAYNASLDTTSIDIPAGDIPHMISGSTFRPTGPTAALVSFKNDAGTSFAGIPGIPYSTVTINGVSSQMRVFSYHESTNVWTGDEPDDLYNDGNLQFQVHSVFGVNSSNVVVFLGYTSTGMTIAEATAIAPGAYSARTGGSAFATEINSGKPCFVAGSRISTENGLVAIENICVGDMIETLDHGFQPVVWIAKARVSAQGRNAPILFKKGTIGNTEDLLVSPQHRMLVSDWRAQVICGDDEVLIAAKDLVNDKDILRAPTAHVDYYHMMFKSHEIVFAEGVPSESFHPGENNLGTLADDARDEIFRLFPELETNVDVYGMTARDCIKSHEVIAMNGLTQ